MIASTSWAIKTYCGSLGLCAAAATAIGIDQATKFAARFYLEEGYPIVLAPFLNLTLNFNRGISFGFFSADSGLEVAALILLTSLAVGAVFVLTLKTTSWRERFALSFLAGGGASNIIDRVKHGAVTDFIDLHLAGWHWPTFNVADISIALGVSLLFLTFLGGVQPSAAGEFVSGSLKISHPWSRATPPGTKVAGGYLTITNGGAEADRLIGGSSDVAERIEMHQTTVVDGIARMRLNSSGIAIQPGQTVIFGLGNTHIMFVGLRRPLTEGEHIAGTLVFEKAGVVAIEYVVEKMGSSSDHSGH